jgi:hypothetical protein
MVDQREKEIIAIKRLIRHERRYNSSILLETFVRYDFKTGAIVSAILAQVFPATGASVSAQ